MVKSCVHDGTNRMMCYSLACADPKCVTHAKCHPDSIFDSKQHRINHINCDIHNDTNFISDVNCVAIGHSVASVYSVANSVAFNTVRCWLVLL